MKLVNRFVLLLCLWSVASVAGAQCTTPPPASGCTFQAFDAGGQVITSFCVGQPVRFASCPGRVLDPNFTRYGVRNGTNVPYQDANGNCAPPNLQPYTYTPQASDVGYVTVSELSNLGANAFFYIRTFQVYGTAAPAFTVAPCPTGFVAITITDTAYNTYTVEIPGTTATTTYQATQGQAVPPLPVPAGATQVLLTGRYTALSSCPSFVSRQLITPISPPVKPTLNSLTQLGPLPGSLVTFVYSNMPGGYRYDLKVADANAPGGFREVYNISANPSPLTQNNIVPGCYRVYRTDACNLLPDFSNTICTVGLTGSSALNRNRLVLTTDADPTTTSYAVTRTPATATPLRVVNGTVDDADVQCGTRYTYRVAATQLGGGVAVSNEEAITTQSSLQPRQPQLLASFNLNNVVELTPLLAVPLTTGSSLRYRRAAGALPPTDFRTLVTTARAQRDSTALAELLTLRPCYSVRLTDNCGIDSEESAATCPALLTAAALDADGTTVGLTWTPFTGPNPAAAYTLQRLSAAGAVLSSVPVSGSSYSDLGPPTDQQILRYRLQISGAGLPPGTVSYSNIATITRRLTLTIPTAFTPNGDGLNDVLEVKGKYLNGYTFVVVDRNGQEVFRGTQRADTWDGAIRGHTPVPGSYVWRFQQTDEENKPFSATGAITILK